MKKLVMMTASAGLILALAACGSTSTPEVTTAAETTVAAEETTVAAEETTVAAEETTAAAEETTAAAEETTAAAEETTVAAEDGETLTGTAKGFGGDVTVTLTMDGDKIVAATIEGKDETPTVGGAAFEELEKQIVEAGSADIDGVSGATLTSTGVKDAVKAALAK
ncbi:FMN-binding protein [Oribacterium sp. WCC10]|uniref:FMN-binding protein n=1 Tax=Oribacterium sp. WCC10 TaxID=1855343 RepID=UPI0008F35A20|nr:FMN-binding protein [Oribacterium sp. WCC10]SFG14625.1 FMN-binding domain-containing protein [Oribacterium sp. WCC10]